MWVENKATRHVVDLKTNFSATNFIEQQTIEGVWDVFVTFSAPIYVGFDMEMSEDQGSAFTSVKLTHRADIVGTVVQTSVVESHNSLGSGERHHASLQRALQNNLERSKNRSKNGTKTGN